MNVLTENQTPLWTLIGVTVGFALNWLYSALARRREYRQRVTQAIERVKSGMHLEGSRLGPQRISDLLPQFRERDQMQILGEVGFESSLNPDTDQVTHYVLDELRWQCLHYEVFPQHHHIKRSRHDARRVDAIQSLLGNIAVNIVEYRQSDPLLRKVFALGNILHTYGVVQRYPDVISGQISMYRDVGKHSVGIMYGVTGYKVLNFQYGVQGALGQLRDLSEQVRRSTLAGNVRDKLIAESDAALGIIRNEQAKLNV